MVLSPCAPSRWWTWWYRARESVLPCEYALWCDTRGVRVVEEKVWNRQKWVSGEFHHQRLQPVSRGLGMTISYNRNFVPSRNLLRNSVSWVHPARCILALLRIVWSRVDAFLWFWDNASKAVPRMTLAACNAAHFINYKYKKINQPH